MSKLRARIRLLSLHVMSEAGRQQLGCELIHTRNDGNPAENLISLLVVIEVCLI